MWVTAHVTANFRRGREFHDAARVSQQAEEGLLLQHRFGQLLSDAVELENAAVLEGHDSLRRVLANPSHHVLV